MEHKLNVQHKVNIKILNCTKWNIQLRMLKMSYLLLKLNNKVKKNHKTISNSEKRTSWKNLKLCNNVRED